MVEIVDVTQLPREEAIKILMEVFKFDEDYAKFFLALVSGRIGNDLDSAKPGELMTDY